MSEQDQQDQYAGGDQPEPSEGETSQPAVDPVDPNATDDINPDAQPGEQVPGPATASGFDPNRPVPISAPAPDDQSGVVELKDEQAQGVHHAEANATDPAAQEAARERAEAAEAEAAQRSDASESDAV